ncbi:M24 family metallopeptidase [Thermoflavimicrobium daqui]|uniref:Peptidase M24 family protein n=1 Tax=Thermoflavimicrobium daqui TaxID=2137476 RepID=A0A364K6J2_9BACL|nr:Xaa-Pro peptidase family protein [Thermoflavimicrobium daqui]RAL25810.1 peptidase M24 family protein [Thermoflavimicrobium daqui]
MDKRLYQVISWLQNEQLDMAMIHSSTNVYYLTQFMCEPHERFLGLFIFPHAEPFLICPLLDVDKAQDSGWSYTVIGYDDVENPWEIVRNEVRKRLPNRQIRIAIEKERVSYARVEQLTQVIASNEIVSIDEEINKWRLIKTDQEIDWMREAARLADYGVEIGMNFLKKGCTEMEVLGQIELELKKKGIEGMAFDTMVLFGEKSALPHGTPGLRELNKGDMVLFDLGVKWKGYCSDITRTVAFGTIDEKQQEIYEVVLQAQLEALNHCKPDIRVGNLDQAARSVIEEAGYGKYFTHRVGHGLGMELHEYPSLNATNENLLQVGMTFTIEPGIYIPNLCGVRIEDDVVITTTGYETLTSFPKELQVIC